MRGRGFMAPQSLSQSHQVNTSVQEAGPNQFYLTLEQVESINHVVVFLTGQVPFSEGFGGAIYFGLSAPDGGVSWQLLGFITNSKPSAIFKITNIKPTGVDQSPFGQAMMESLGQISSTTALIGISVEPLSQLVQQTPSSHTQASTVDSLTEFSQKMLENFFNYASSFAVVPAQGPMNMTDNYVPLGVVQHWYENFQRKLQANPSFWKAL